MEEDMYLGMYIFKVAVGNEEEQLSIEIRGTPKLKKEFFKCTSPISQGDVLKCEYLYKSVGTEEVTNYTYEVTFDKKVIDGDIIPQIPIGQSLLITINYKIPDDLPPGEYELVVRGNFSCSAKTIWVTKKSLNLPLIPLFISMALILGIAMILLIILPRKKVHQKVTPIDKPKSHNSVQEAS